MTLIPPGEFMMGSTPEHESLRQRKWIPTFKKDSANNEQPLHHVRITSAFLSVRIRGDARTIRSIRPRHGI